MPVVRVAGLRLPDALARFDLPWPAGIPRGRRKHSWRRSGTTGA